MNQNFNYDNSHSVPMELDEPFEDFATTQCTDSSFIYNTPRIKHNPFLEKGNNFSLKFNKQIKNGFNLMSNNYNKNKNFSTNAKLNKNEYMTKKLDIFKDTQITKYFDFKPKETLSDKTLSTSYKKEKKDGFISKKEINPFKIGMNFDFEIKEKIEPKFINIDLMNDIDD